MRLSAVCLKALRGFRWQSFLFLSLALIVWGVLVSCGSALSSLIGVWGVSFVPFFLFSGVVLGAGAVVVRYHHNPRNDSFPKILSSCWEPLLHASYLGLPLLLAFLVFWIMLAVVLLLKSIPYLGPFFGIVLAFAPFILILGIFLLVVSVLFFLYFATPPLAEGSFLGLKGLLAKIQQIIRKDTPRSFLMWFFALSVLLIGTIFLTCIYWISYVIYSVGDSIYERALQSFFMMLPFSLLLTPFLQFYFLFAAEVYELSEEKKAENLDVESNP